ncbi:MAG: ribonuclease E/G, partial [Saprospiraceae bacterium]
LLTDSFNKVVVNDEELYRGIRSYIGEIAPDRIKMVQLHKGRKPIFDEYGVTRQIKTSFGKTVTIPSGAYLVIEHTEAMHVIDVNSGHKTGSKEVGASALKVNLDCAKETARQLRMRDIGGLIIIDFIDMRDANHRKELLSEMRKYMKDDRAQHTILPLSKFGLMQITRQRTGPVVKIDTSEKCSTCNGTGKAQASIIVTDEIERDLEFVLQSHPKVKVTLKVHPYVEAFFKKGFPSQRIKWWMKHGRNVRIEGNNNFALMDYKFYDGNSDEIRLN